MVSDQYADGKESNVDDLTFKGHVLKALKNFRLFQSKNAKQAFAPILFVQNFFFDDVVHLNRGSVFKQQKVNGLEITV